MPEPASGESESDYISRCIEQTINDGTTDDPKQAAAICYSKWGENKKRQANAMNMAAQKHQKLLQAVKGRNGRGLRLGQGIWTADKYAGSLLECVGPGLCNSALAGSLKNFSAVMKHAESTLTYAGPLLEIEKDSFGNVKLATSTASIKNVLKDVELPKHSMLAFTHVLTTPREDRDGDVLETEGAVVDEKMPLLWQHVHTLPIGRMLKVVEHTAQRLKLASVLLDLNQLTSDAAKLFEAGALRFSHGFRALDFSERNKEAAGALGFRVKAFEIMEESGVSVPSNIEAEVELLSRGKLKSEVFKMHAKSMQRLLPKKHAGVEMPKRLKFTEQLGDYSRTIEAGSFDELKEAIDSGIGGITVKGGEPGREVTAGQPSGAAAHDHHHGLIETASAKFEHDRTHGGCGCGGKCGKCGDQKAVDLSTPAGRKAAMERENYRTEDEASMRATILGCAGTHQVIGADGNVVWHRPCTDPYELGLHLSPTPDTQQNKPPVTGIDRGSNGGGPADATAGTSQGNSKPPESGSQPAASGISQGGPSSGGGTDYVTGGSGRSKPPKPPAVEMQQPAESHVGRDWTLGKSGKRAASGTKLYMDASSIEGSYGYRQAALSQDAGRFLMAAGVDVDRNDGVFCWALFDDYGIICVADYSGPMYEGGECYYRAGWTEGADGQPEWSGLPEEVEITSDINIAAVTKNLRDLLGMKVGRTLSKVNVDKLQQVRDDLAELNGKELPRTVTALAERCMRTIDEVLNAANPIEDDDPQPKSAKISDSEAADILLESKDANLLKRTGKIINALLSVHRADIKARDLRKLLRR